MEKIRLDKYLSKVLGVSRSQVAHLIEKKMVLVNGVVAEKNGVWVEESDRVEIAESATFCHSERSEESKKNHFVILSEAKYLKKNQNRDSSVATLSQNDNVGRDSSLRLRSARNDENSARIAESALDSADSQNLGLKIQRLYEDDDILVLNKPPFLATHGAPSLKEPSLVEWLKAHKIQRSTISGELREGIVHRLDKQTSGALVVAKNNAAHQALSAQLADKTMTRLYLAIIDLPLKEDIEIECFLARNPKNRLKISKVDVRKIRRFAESVKNNPCEAPKNSPASWCKKSESKGAEVPPADFLLEADKRGSPPKSEKAAAFWRVGGAGRGVQPFLREKTSEFVGKGGAESTQESQGGWLLRNARKSFGLPRSHSLARNDEFAIDSALPKFARYSKSKFFKLLPSKDGKKELILARLFTGRTHQIRAHLESINRHIIGDELYGYKRGKGENYRVMLHAYLLQLVHPKDFITQNSAESALDSADSQNLVKNQSREAQPLASSGEGEGVVREGEGSDFAIQAPAPSLKKNARGEKGESKADLSAHRRGEIDSTNSQNLQGGLPRSHSLARNDEILDSSLRLHSAQNDNMGAWNDKIKQSQNDNLMGFAESNADSATRTKSAESNEKNKSKKPIKSFCSVWLKPKVESPLPLNHNLSNNADSAKLRFIAPLFDDMQDYLAKNFDMEKVNEILRTLPARAF